MCGWSRKKEKIEELDLRDRASYPDGDDDDDDDNETSTPIDQGLAPINAVDLI